MDNVSDYIRLLESRYEGSIIIFYDPMLIYMKIPRTGGTSALSVIKRNAKILKGDSRKRVIASLTDESLADYFIFSFVRNPWDRVISVSKYFHFKPKHIVAGKIRNAEIKKKADFHSVPCSEFTHVDGKLFVDFVGRFERLQEDFDILCGIIGIKKTSLPVLSKSRFKGEYRSHYGDKLQYAVRQKYKDDIRNFEYKF